MLDVAINHTEELRAHFRDVWFEDKYKFWNNGNYYEEFEIRDSTWTNHQFVSLDTTGKIIGYIGYTIDRSCDFVCGLNIINFSDNMAVFGMDSGKALKDIFEKFKFRKLCFDVVVGNPIEKTYDRMIAKYGGRVVGVQKGQIRLIDNQFYDLKMYEIFMSDYYHSRGKANANA